MLIKKSFFYFFNSVYLRLVGSQLVYYCTIGATLCITLADDQMLHSLSELTVFGESTKLKTIVGQCELGFGTRDAQC